MPLSNALASPFKVTIIVLGSLAVSGARNLHSQVTPLLELRLARDTPAAGFEYVPPLMGTDSFYLATEAVVDDADIEHVRVDLRDEQLLLDVRWTEQGATRLREATAANIGGRLGVVFDSRLLNANVIRSPIGHLPRILLGVHTTGVPEATIDEMVRKVEARWEP